MDYTWLIIWLVLFVILTVIEMITTSVTAVWFGCGCLAGAVMAAFKMPIWAQIAAFALLSLILFAFVRPGAKRRFDKGRRLSELRKMIGSKALVISEIDNLRGIGEIRLEKREWGARSFERGVLIPVGAVVRVIDVQGEIMIVRLDESTRNNIAARDSEARLDPNIRLGLTGNLNEGKGRAGKL